MEIRTVERWKRAVVHLECATDSQAWDERISKIRRYQEQLKNGEISYESIKDDMWGGSRDRRFHGTALFLSHKDARYLLTARHVLWDETSAKRELEKETVDAARWPENTRAVLIGHATERARDRIFQIILRVPSVDEVMSGKKDDRAFLMNLGAGSPNTVPYTFSIPDVDLAVVSLDQRDSRFANELETRGYKPIMSDEIADGPDFEGQEVFTVGYPSSTALIGQVNLDKATKNWASDYCSLPVSSFGRVSMMHPVLPFFWADMSIYPGNSGGPLVANDRLAGIVVQNAVLPIDSVPTVATRIPFAKIIKSQFVHQMLEAQRQKDQFMQGMLSRGGAAAGAGPDANLSQATPSQGNQPR